MSLKALASALGIDEYPEKFEKLYGCVNLNDISVCDVERLKQIEADYKLFKNFLPDVIEGARQLSKKEKLLAWANILCEYLKDCERLEAYSVPFPESDGSVAGNLFRLYVMLSLLPRCIDFYTRHGFCHDEIANLLNVFHGSLCNVKSSTDKVGMDGRFYHWTLHYLLGEMFQYGSFNFQFRSYHHFAILLKNKSTKEYTILMTAGRFHRSGQVLGSAGYEDEENAFDADFKETDNSFMGHAAIDGYVSPELREYKKSEWECVLRQGDTVISVHIPQNADLTPEAVQQSYEGGMKFAKERFPELMPKCYYCGSWIIDPRLEDILGSESKIVKFGKTFLRYPIKCSQREGFHFVFPSYNGKDEDLPENTTLQKKFKAIYLSGGFTYSSGGIVAE